MYCGDRVQRIEVTLTLIPRGCYVLCPHGLNVQSPAAFMASIHKVIKIISSITDLWWKIAQFVIYYGEIGRLECVDDLLLSQSLEQGQ